MTTLYKRYIPPTTSTKTTVAPIVVNEKISKPNPVASQTETPRKRKRERTEEEIAERKAKKLKKKGLDQAPAGRAPSKPADVSSSSKKTARQDVDAPKDEDSTLRPQGEFAHVKNAKKRHKLEKEARKAKKAVNHVGHDISSTAESERDTNQEPTSSRTRNDTSLNGSKEHREEQGVHDEDVAKTSQNHEESVNSSTAHETGNEKTMNLKHGKSWDQATNAAFDGDADPRGSTELELAQSQPKKRRHKLEAVLKDVRAETTDEVEDVDEHLRKHSGVMHRFSQSKRVSSISHLPSRESTEPEHPPLVLDLAPLPQPEQAATIEFKPDASAVPKWLAEPTIISSATNRSFDELKLQRKLVQQLAGLGFTNAMPVQQALIPLLLPSGTPGSMFLPGTESVVPDVAIGAPTGSGKTIAYFVPIIESLKTTADQGKLKVLVIVPTRELVIQVAAVADSLARGTGLKIGMATGTGSFRDEQSRIVSTGRRYDPEAYRQLLKKAHRWNYPPAEDSEDFLEYLDELEALDVKEEKRLQDFASILVDHVPTYRSAVDILIATPGRLLEHLDKTLGFTLAQIEWLILDEADKLVDQQYDGFLEAVNQQLSQPRRPEEQDARERFLRAEGSWNEQKERRTRKVVLSATMTRDISKLMELKLKRPRLILVQSEMNKEGFGASNEQATSNVNQKGMHEFELPSTLVECCVHVGDGSEKPLYLVKLLDKKILSGHGPPSQINGHAAPRMEKAQPQQSSSESTTNSSEEDDSCSDESSEDENYEVKKSLKHQTNVTTSSRKDAAMNDVADLHPERAALLNQFKIRRQPFAAGPVVLVFVSSTESAQRLAHLLGSLKPEWSSYIRTMTRADSKKSLSQPTPSSDPVIAISTDRAARGLDTVANQAITHVVQYDIPRSATGYIHRVGRTARASRHGEAWTLYTHSEARWFYKGICKATSIKRAEPVEKVKIALDEGKEKRDQLVQALEGMKKDVYGS